ncbi:MAG TPA: hypothetical protein DIU00_10325 [Phycisphaerales bacterium]|nr:hypothetical protein [Phycisphaerales bacterium]
MKFLDIQGLSMYFPVVLCSMILRRITIRSFACSISESKLVRGDGQDKSAALPGLLETMPYHFLAIRAKSDILVSESLMQQLI